MNKNIAFYAVLTALLLPALASAVSCTKTYEGAGTYSLKTGECVHVSWDSTKDDSGGVYFRLAGTGQYEVASLARDQARFEIYNAIAGNLINQVTLSTGQEFTGSETTALSTARKYYLKVIEVGDSTTDSSVSVVKAQFKTITEPAAPTPTPTLMATVAPTPIQAPGVASCPELTSVEIVEGASVSTCGFTLRVTRYHPWEDYGKVSFSLNGVSELSARGYRNVYGLAVDHDGAPAVFVRFNQNNAGLSTGVKTMRPFEKYFTGLRVGQSFTLADNTVVRVTQAYAKTDGWGYAILEVQPGSSDSTPQTLKVSTNQFKQLPGTRSSVQLDGVREDGRIFLGVTPSVDLAFGQGGPVTPQTIGFDIGIVGNGDVSADDSAINKGTLYRQVRACNDDKPFGDSQAIPFWTGYGNYVCSSRKNEHCNDGTPDAYYEEWCTGQTRQGYDYAYPTQVQAPKNVFEVIKQFIAPTTSSEIAQKQADANAVPAPITQIEKPPKPPATAEADAAIQKPSTEQKVEGVEVTQNQRGTVVEQTRVSKDYAQQTDVIAAIVKPIQNFVDAVVAIIAPAPATAATAPTTAENA